MNLHYSQTPDWQFQPPFLFYTSMNLHYSQTIYSVYAQDRKVLYLYEFTLLSNIQRPFTFAHRFYTSMNLHYSQTALTSNRLANSFYTSMNLHYSQTPLR